jgi:TATA-binding protein-associated factor
MGLGKTIQSLCAIAEAHLDHPNSFSLIVCPASVVGHWLKEAKSYLDLPVHEHPDHGKGLLVISYNILNTNIEKIKKLHFLYAVLDEGHLLSNPKTKTFKAVKSISSTYRLILTGTPIQNKILDVWPFFDFLMPGFLGTQSDFTSTYQKHLKAKKVSNSVKFKDEYRALQKLHALHKKILPFALRRLKKDILQDLPEKIIQDYYIDLTSVQSSLIKNYNVSSKNALENLTFIEKVCFHPFLVDKKFVDEESPKLNALKELLEDCEISEEAGASHKALVFSKSKKVLDLVEKCLRLNFPETRFLRLDGDTPQVKRYEICNEFNQNLQVRVLIVTTKAGGVGLNLQAASVVIFIDHSWNPVADMQAMDRAHRIGQKKVVNIYRLIARDSLEEEILGLQVFKSKLASALVNTENSCMSSVDSVNLLSSFNQNT